MLFGRLLIIFKINFFEKLFQEYHQNCLFVCFVALCSKSTAMVKAGYDITVDYFLHFFTQGKARHIFHKTRGL